MGRSTDRHGHDVAAIDSSVVTTTLPRLALRIAFGGSDAAILPETHQRLQLAQVLDELRNRLKAFRPLVGMPGFTDTVFAFLSQLKGQGVSPEEFEATAHETADGPDARDRDVALIYGAYQALLRNNDWLDRDAVYRRAAERLGDRSAAVLDPATVVQVDGFSDFTPPQRELLRGLTGRVGELWVTLPADAVGDDSRAEMFAPASDTLAELVRLFPDAEIEHLRASSVDRPAGLAHVHNQLFRDVARRSADPAGVRLLEAPGVVGELRMVARAVKELILAGGEPCRVLVCARDLQLYGELIEEIFASYGIPLDHDAARPLAQVPEVRTLLAAARLPDDGWPFAPTAALLQYADPPAGDDAG